MADNPVRYLVTLRCIVESDSPGGAIDRVLAAPSEQWNRVVTVEETLLDQVTFRFRD